MTVQRRLAAILAADVVGYTGLMERDEEGTLQRLKSLRADVFDPVTSQHRGRIFKNTGDGALAEFASAVGAVQCAVEIQRVLAERNAELSEHHRIALRIGISLGDVIIEGDDLYGNGVNVAARMEGLAETGGICISSNVYEHVGKALDVAYQDLGDKPVKNIDRPIRTYRVVIDGVGLNESRSKTRQASLPDQPSIAVLPFQNMSGDPEQDYFADGITEDLITDLSKISSLFVVARNSTFAYKGKDTDVRALADDLGVEHVLEGSVRRAGGTVRINAQLIDARSGGHLWAERYDGDFADIFALQDEINAKIASALELTLTSRDQARIERKPTESAEAYEHLLRARSEYYRYNPESMASAMAHLKTAIELDPGFADAYGYLSYCRFTVFVCMWPGADADLIPAVNLAEKAVSLDPESAVAYTRLAWVQGFLRRFDESLPNFEKAISLDPNNAETYAAYSEVLNHWGDAQRALEMNARAVSIDTIPPPSWEYHFGHAYMVLGRYDEAIAKLRLAVELAPGFLPGQVRLVCAYVEAGRMDEARQTAATVLELAPKFSIAHWDRIAPHRRDEQRERFIVALRKAGLPE